MSDAADAVAEAIALNKKLAAARLVRKDELEAEIARLKARGAATSDLEAELATVVAEARAAMDEVKELMRMGGRAKAMAPVAEGPGDPFARDFTREALERARSHIKDLDVQARTGDATTPAPEAARPKTREEADADARAEFERLKEQARKPGKKTL